MKIQYQAVISRGEIIFKDVFSFQEHIKGLEGKDVTITISTTKHQRSPDQNNYYWGIVISMIAKETGQDKDEVHDAMRMKFLRDLSKNPPTLKSTSDLNTVDFIEYIEHIRVWSAHFLGLSIPDPKEVE